MNRIRILVLAVLCAVSAQATGVTITGPIKNADGTNVTGRMTISWDQFISVDGVSIARRTISRTITNGAIVEALVLEPAAVASPVSTYSVTIYPNGGGLYVQRWLVPESGSPLTVGSIIVSSLPAPGLSIALTQLRVTGCAKGGILAMSTSWGCLAIGSNGKVLTADSTKMRGLDWVTPSASGTAFRVAVDGTLQTARTKLNLIAGQNVVLTPADNSGTDSTDVTVASTDVLDIARVEPPDDPSVGRVRCYTDEGDSNFKCRDSDGNVSTMIYPIFHEANKMVRWVSTTGHPILEYLPDPSDTLKGGVKSKTCDVGDFVSEIGTDGSVTCGTPSGGGGGGSGTVTVVASGSLPSTALVTGGGSQTIQAPSSTATLDTDGKITAPGGIETGTGGIYSGFFGVSGVTSGGPIGFAAADIAGSSIAYVLPTVGGEAGQVLSDGGVTTCPTMRSGAPTVCHSTIWITPSAGSGGASVAVTAWASRPTTTSGNQVVTHFTDSPYSIIDSGAALYTSFQGEIITRIDPSEYSWVNQIGATESFANGYAALTSNVGTGAGVINVAMRVKTAPATPYTYSLKFGNNRKFLSAGGFLSGILFRNSSTGKWTGMYVGASNLLFQISDFNSPTSFSANFFNDTASPIVPFVWMQITDDGANKTWSVSNDGHYFYQLFSRTSSTFAGTTDQVGYFVDAEVAASGTVQTQVYAVQ